MQPIPPERFDELVGLALDEIPDEIAECMENVAVFAEDMPDEELLEATGDDGCGVGDLLGIYQGIDQTNRSPLSYGGVMPDRITLFRIPLMRAARNEHDLQEQIKVTVVHEIGHHFGIDDDRLHELGWA